MKASKKKSATLSIAITVFGGAITAFANGNYVPAGVMFVIGAAFLSLYEFYNVEQIKGVDPEQVRSASRAFSDSLKGAVSKMRNRNQD